MHLQSFPIYTNEWDCIDAGRTINIFKGMCKGLIFKSVPNQEQYFNIRIGEEGGETQQWRMEPVYQGQRMISKEPKYIEIDTVIKVALLVSWRTQIIVFDEIITEIDAHDPAEMIWWPGLRDVVMPLNGNWSDPVYYYPLRSGYLRVRSGFSGGTGWGFNISSECESTGAAYSLRPPFTLADNTEVVPAIGALAASTDYAVYLTQGLRYKIMVNQAAGLADETANIDLATVHGGYV